MMGPRHLHYEDDDASFGPGTDLVLSLFAVLLLIAAYTWSAQVIGKLREPSVIAQLSDSSTNPLFARGSDQLTSNAKKRIRQLRTAIRAGFATGQFNNIRLSGYASAEGTINLELSGTRAIEVAKYVRETTGVPSECMFVAGFGNSTSGALRDWLSQSQDRDIDSWSELSINRQVEEVGEKRLAEERYVEILGVYNPASVCKWSPNER